MKHIKTYENIEYKKDDYVLIKCIFTEPLSKHDNLINVLDGENTAFGKIDQKNNNTITYPFRVTFSDGSDLAVDDNEIIRKLTPDEIRTYHINQDISKYNL